MTTRDLIARDLRIALSALDDGLEAVALHFAKKAVRTMEPEEAPKTGKPEHISKPVGRVLEQLNGKVEG